MQREEEIYFLFLVSSSAHAREIATRPSVRANEIVISWSDHPGSCDLFEISDRASLHQSRAKYHCLEQWKAECSIQRSPVHDYIGGYAGGDFGCGLGENTWSNGAIGQRSNGVISQVLTGKAVFVRRMQVAASRFCIAIEYFRIKC